MHRFLIALLLGTFLAAASWAQDADSDEADVTEETQVEAEESDTEDDSDLDEQTYYDTDDDFRPSEDIPADQSIAFPTDI
ncbi:MAG: hypothetical protein GWP02_04210 [Desulfobulbaceae bacterium]|nr:hypothetical protein [Desulfobulbaceae bacterium]